MMRWFGCVKWGVLTTIGVLLSVLVSCEQRPTAAVVMPVVTDILIFKPTLKTQPSGTAVYPPLYFGPLIDTVQTGHGLRHYPPPPPPPPSEDNDSSKYLPIPDYMLPNYDRYYLAYPSDKGVSVDSVSLTILVDTQQIITVVDFRMLDGGNIAFEAHPVLIYNPSNTTVHVGYGRDLLLLLEVQDAQGAWQAVEQPVWYRCDLGVPRLVLPPGEIAITAVPRYAGSQAALLRLRMGEHCSAPFWGKLDGVPQK